MPKFRDTIRLSRIKSVGVPEENLFFKGAIIGGAISLVLWGIIFKLIF
jgi:hypothetical protein